MSLADVWTKLKTWAETEIKAVEGGIEAFAAQVEPAIEADIEWALNTFGQDVMGLVVGKLNTGLSPHETVSEAADSLIQKAEADGKSIVNATARTAGAQLVAAAQTQLGALAPNAAAAVSQG